jgi:hypothetical protein
VLSEVLVLDGEWQIADKDGAAGRYLGAIAAVDANGETAENCAVERERRLGLLLGAENDVGVLALAVRMQLAVHAGDVAWHVGLFVGDRAEAHRLDLAVLLEERLEVIRFGVGGNIATENSASIL